MLDSERAYILSILEKLVDKNLEAIIREGKVNPEDISSFKMANEEQAKAFMKAIELPKQYIY